MESGNITYNTYAGCEVNVRLHIKPNFGELLVKDAKRRQIEGILRGMHTSAAKEGDKKLRTNSLRYVLRNLHSCFELAIDEEIRHDNPTRKVELPVDEAAFVAEGLEPSEVRQLLQAVQNEDIDLIVNIAIYMQMRISEIIALRKEDIRIESKQMYICHQWSKAKDGILGFCKLKSGKPRYSAIPEDLMCQLQEYIEPLDDKDFLFDRGDGIPISRHAVGNSWKRIKNEKKIGSHIRLHGLRHIGNNLLKGAGVSQEVRADRLGQSDIKTNDIYTKYNNTLDRDAANRMDNLRLRNVNDMQEHTESDMPE